MWGTYLRCHDDIGWAIDDGDAASVGLNGFEHRRFLADYYAGLYPMSDARGLVFQENLETGDRRISGTAASLARHRGRPDSGDDSHLDLAVRRLLLAYRIVLGFGGLPLIYMGDELALRNDYDFVDDPEHADDNRWVHRPPMPWDVGRAAARRGHRRAPGLASAAARDRGPFLAAEPGRLGGDGDPRPGEPGGAGVPPTVPEPDHGRRLQHDHRSQKLPRWVVPLGNWAWDALTEETPLTDGPLIAGGYQVRWFVQQT